MLYRYGKRQTEDLVEQAHPGGDWYREVIDREKQFAEINFTQYEGAPQGFMAEINWTIPDFFYGLPESFIQGANQVCDNFFFGDRGSQLVVEHYLETHGGWIMVNTPARGSCLFHGIRRGLETPAEYTNRIFRRELVTFSVQHADILYRQHFSTLFSTYGKKSAMNTSHPHKGPYSIRSYLKTLLQRGTWGDDICLDMISRMWGIRITVLDTTEVNYLQERRIRHQLTMDKADLVLLFDSDAKHYSAVIRNRKKSIPVFGIMDAEGLEMQDTSDYEDTSDDEWVGSWDKWLAGLSIWSYLPKPAEYKV